MRDDERKGRLEGAEMVFVLPQDAGELGDATWAENGKARQRAASGDLEIDEEGYVTKGGRRVENEEQVAKRSGRGGTGSAALCARAHIPCFAPGRGRGGGAGEGIRRGESTGVTFIHVANARWEFRCALALQRK